MWGDELVVGVEMYWDKGLVAQVGVEQLWSPGKSASQVEIFTSKRLLVHATLSATVRVAGTAQLRLVCKHGTLSALMRCTFLRLFTPSDVIV